METLILMALGSYLTYDHIEDKNKFQSLEATDRSMQRVIVDHDERFKALSKSIDEKQKSPAVEARWMPANYSM